MLRVLIIPAAAEGYPSGYLAQLVTEGEGRYAPTGHGAVGPSPGEALERLEKSYGRSLSDLPPLDPAAVGLID